MTTREQIIAAAKEAGFNPGFLGHIYVGSSTEAVERFYAIAHEAGAASRDAEIADLKRELDNEQARDIHSCHPNCSREGCVNRRLRAELAAAIAACKAKDEALRHLWNERTPDSYDEAGAAIAIQPDDAALEAIVKKAGEVMREKCVEYMLLDRKALDSDQAVFEAIRALPAVTLEDLK